MKIQLFASALLFCTTCYGVDFIVSGHLENTDKQPVPNQRIILMKHPALKDSTTSLEPDDLMHLADKMTTISISDHEGAFIFTGVNTGKYIIAVLSLSNAVDAPQYSAVSLEVINCSLTNILLTPSVIDYHSIYGIIRSTSSGKPIKAELIFSPDNPGSVPGSVPLQLDLLQSVSTDDNGVFTKSNMPSGTYTVMLKSLDNEISGRSTIGFKIAVSGSEEPINENYQRYLKDTGLDIVIHSRY